MVAQAEFSTVGVVVQPGDTETIEMRLTNIGNTTETYTLVPSGLLAGWVRVEPPSVTLFGGTSEDVTVTLRPPRVPSTPAGPAPLTIRIIPLDDPDEVVIAESTAVIGAFHERSIDVLQPVVRGHGRATFEFLVRNTGNSQANCRLRLIDTSKRLDGDFDPQAVGIEPGGSTLVRLRLKAVRPQWSRGSRTIPFTIEADQQGYPTAEAPATFVQTSLVPEHLGRRIATAALLVAALLGAWFGIVRPATRDAARDAVRDAPDSNLTVTTPVATQPGPTSSTSPGATTSATQQSETPEQTEAAGTATTAPPVPITVSEAGGAEDGAFFSRRLVATANASAGSEPQVIDIPVGQELHVTDLGIQNLSRDSGIATVRKGDEIIQQWDLSRVLDNIDIFSFRTGFVFEGGTQLVFEVACDAPGTSGGCVDGLLVTGRLVTVSAAG